MRKKLIVGLVGLPGAGKSTIARYLATKGFFPVRLSGLLGAETKKQYGKINRENLQNVGNKFREEYGPAILAQWALEKAEKKQKIVIDGLRNLAEIKFLKGKGDFFLLGIEADPKVRYQRLLKLKTKALLPKWEEFIRLDARDRGLGQSKSGLQVDKCWEQADQVIKHNDRSPAELYKKIDELLLSL